MKTRKWKYQRVSRFKTEDRTSATREVGSEFKYHTTTRSEFVFRRPLIANGSRLS